jgi:hypothetical protein
VIYKKAECKECGKEGYITKPALGLCNRCNQKRLSGKKEKVAKPEYGQREMFDQISKERPHVCEVCGVAIFNITISSFAHIIPKGKYPRFKMLKENIAILCHDYMAGKSCHHTWDFEPRSKIQDDPKWEWMFNKEAELKERYSRITT